MPAHSKFQIEIPEHVYKKGEHIWTFGKHKEYGSLIDKMKQPQHKRGDILIYKGPNNSRYLVKKGDEVKYVSTLSNDQSKLIMYGINEGKYTQVRDKFFVNLKDLERFDELENSLEKVFGSRLCTYSIKAWGDTGPVLKYYYHFRKRKRFLKKWEKKIEMISRVVEAKKLLCEDIKKQSLEIEEKVNDDDFSDDEVEFNPFEYRGVTYHRDEDNLYNEDGDYVGYIIIKREEEREEEKCEDQLIGYSAF